MRIVLFDMMDTLLRDPYHTALQDLLRSANRDEFLKWRDRSKFERFECGELSEEEYFRTYYKAETPDDARSRLPRPERLKKELLRGVKFLPGVEEIIRELRTQESVYLGIASNYSVWYSDVFRLRPELDQHFHYLFFSCEMGVRKPDPGYYETIEQALIREHGGVEPGTILFIDDREVNLAPANERGWRTHLMRGADGIRAALAEHLA